MELAIADFPGESPTPDIKPPDGIGLVPSFSGDSLKRDKPLFREFGGGAAVQKGDKKLVRKRTWELCDLSKDRTETVIWEELTFEESHYVIRLMIQEIRVRFVKKTKEGEFRIKAWGRSPKPLKVQLDAIKKKLRSQDGWHPGPAPNATFLITLAKVLKQIRRGKY